MALNTPIWYSERVGSLSHTLIKEKLMFKSRTRHLPNCRALSCVGADGLGSVEALQRHDADIVFSDITELGGGQ